MDHKNIMAEIGVEMPELYKVFREFEDMKFRGVEIKTIYNTIFSNSSLNSKLFFIAYGLNTLEKEMEQIKEG